MPVDSDIVASLSKNPLPSLKEILTLGDSNMALESKSVLSRNSLLLAFLKLSLFSATTFLTIKWILSHLDPTSKQKATAAKKAKELLSRLGLNDHQKFTEYELTIASHLMDPKDVKVTWKDIGGLDDVIQELKETVILPIKRPELLEGSVLNQPPKGLLLHGPPGCGKTMIAKATAKEADCRFLNLDVSILTDKWYGESQKLAAAVFSLAKKLQPCIVFIDEIDSFLRNRNIQDHEATAMMKAQFMTLWDGLSTEANCTVIVMGATNRPDDLDPAILRRMPSTFSIGLPNEAQREHIFHLILDNERISSDVNFSQLAKLTNGYSGSDIKELCRTASIYRAKELVKQIDQENGISFQANSNIRVRPISMLDLRKSIEKMIKSKVNKPNP